ncbi:MAG: hypothetical protein P8046_07360 [Anaerolineales bacterium]
MVKKIPLLMLFLAISFSYVGCSRTELARIPIQTTGQFDPKFSHPGGELDLWTDFDIEFSGEATAAYTIALFKEGDIIETLTCDPFQVEESLMTREVEANGLQKISFLALMDCVAFLPAGSYSAEVNFSVEGENLKIFRADLILRQPDN